MNTLTVPAVLEELQTVLTFIETALSSFPCPPKTFHAIAIAVEEIFVNIAHYAYRPDVGEATIRCEVRRQPVQVTIEFLDSGRPYNPLVHDAPDIACSATERSIGGLGILMVKNLMDTVKYEYRDGKNILTIQKNM